VRGVFSLLRSKRKVHFEPHGGSYKAPVTTGKVPRSKESETSVQRAFGLQGPRPGFVGQVSAATEKKRLRGYRGQKKKQFQGTRKRKEAKWAYEIAGGQCFP